jgi:hypothetical protein
MRQTTKRDLAAETTEPKENFMMHMSLADVLRLTMFGTLIGVSNFLLILPIGIPGHTSIYWMGLLVLGKGLLPKPGSGTIMGIVSGILAIVFGLGKEGPLLAFKYIIPGILLDVLAIMFLYQLESVWVGGITGALISLSKLLVNIALGVILQIPMVFLTMGFGYASLLHAIFGAIGGVMASVLIKRLKPRMEAFS